MREKLKQERKDDKARARAERAADRADSSDDGGAPPSVDPDIAHIVPGPQKPLF
ncbi:MAG: hypothetical protein R3F39_25500 [Myxococcota bacterium]